MEEGKEEEGEEDKDEDNTTVITLSRVSFRGGPKDERDNHPSEDDDPYNDDDDNDDLTNNNENNNMKKDDDIKVEKREWEKDIVDINRLCRSLVDEWKERCPTIDDPLSHVVFLMTLYVCTPPTFSLSFFFFKKKNFIMLFI